MRHGPSRRLSLALALALVACGGGADEAAPRDVPPGMPAEGALLRLPADGGRARLYRTDSLTPFDWEVTSGVPEIARGLGTELEDRMVYAVDVQGRLVGLDLIARRARTYLADAERLVATPEGAVLGLDSARRALRFSARAAQVYQASVEGGGTPELLRGPGSQVAAYVPEAGVLQYLGEEGEVRRFPAPAGRADATWHGELLAITTDSGVVFVDPAGRSPEPRFVALRGAPITGAFSPSGHRLYVARGRGDVVVLDRFSGDEVGTIRLPAAAGALRVDRSGRWLLARPESGDSLWVVDLVRRERAVTVQAPWADDLPLVLGGRTLVVRDADDVVAWELTGLRPTERTRLRGAADDVYLAIPWSPEDAAPAPPVAELPEPEPDPAPTDPAPVGVGTPDEPPIPEATPGGTLYIQISSSQNREWAQALAQQLRDGGYPARVLAPVSEGEGYRVVVGPFASRDEADAAGRRLGRPYFVITEGIADT